MLSSCELSPHSGSSVSNSCPLTLSGDMQALAEAEAELVAGSRSEATDLPLRRDSAADMHLQEASPDSRTRPSAPGEAFRPCSWSCQHRHC